MAFNKTQLIKIRELLYLLQDKVPFRKKVSLVVASTLDVSVLGTTIYNLILDDKDIELIIQGLLASGITTGVIIAVIINYVYYFDKNDDSSVKLRNRK